MQMSAVICHDLIFLKVIMHQRIPQRPRTFDFLCIKRSISSFFRSLRESFKIQFLILIKCNNIKILIHVKHIYTLYMILQYICTYDMYSYLSSFRSHVLICIRGKLGKRPKYADIRRCTLCYTQRPAYFQGHVGSLSAYASVKNIRYSYAYHAHGIR